MNALIFLQPNMTKNWMTKGIRNSIMMKIRLYKKYINRQNDNNKTIYQQYKNKLLLYGRQINFIIAIYSYMQSILPVSYGKFTQNLSIRVNGILPMLKSWLSTTLT